MLVGYARTSTIEQAAGLAAQKRDLKAASCEKIGSAAREGHERDQNGQMQAE
jgi:DNA invertase Pin-like site-specific DNA recombinase